MHVSLCNIIVLFILYCNILFLYYVSLYYVYFLFILYCHYSCYSVLYLMLSSCYSVQYLMFSSFSLSVSDFVYSVSCKIFIPYCVHVFSFFFFILWCVSFILPVLCKYIFPFCNVYDSFVLSYRFVLSVLCINYLLCRRTLVHSVLCTFWLIFKGYTFCSLCLKFTGQ